MNNSVSNSPHHKTTSWGSMGIIAHLDEKFLGFFLVITDLGELQFQYVRGVCGYNFAISTRYSFN
jgi:hypothetical protein